ncbi:twin-arginine translocation signal domain-containing protein [Halomonas sp. 22501_18_FS]|uniref:Twin-arginine translocation signal domain-containing protein n=1 Tax=Vreelandella halophila TaxID=86177 RepID=A0A9X5B2Y8_9GAMM|nr:twin-arginine translocation signal domain-containing protein [Halomonas utahensis]MYL75317.1 twin-arginine translocation signal domain-containing protein [Halomonas sp. 22501_18_FS]
MRRAFLVAETVGAATAAILPWPGEGSRPWPLLQR